MIGYKKKPFKALNAVSMEIHTGMFGLLDLTVQVKPPLCVSSAHIRAELWKNIHQWHRYPEKTGRIAGIDRLSASGIRYLRKPDLLGVFGISGSPERNL